VAAIVVPGKPGTKYPDLKPFPENFIGNDSEFDRWHVSEGDDVLMLSFHPSAEGDLASSAIVRQGVIAEFAEQADTYLVSLPVFPGNSGAPIVLKPTAVHGSQGGAVSVGINPPILMGVVIGYLPYIEPAISAQTHRIRVTFEENSGLTRVVRAQRISEVLKQVRTARPELAPQT